MDTFLKLTAAEIERYAPYHLWSEFTMGHDDYLLGALYGHWTCRRPDGESLQEQVGGQAYDRGAECAMRRRMISHRKIEEAA
jgi:hypothetical protein